MRNFFVGSCTEMNVEASDQLGLNCLCLCVSGDEECIQSKSVLSLVAHTRWKTSYHFRLDELLSTSTWIYFCIVEKKMNVDSLLLFRAETMTENTPYDTCFMATGNSKLATWSEIIIIEQNLSLLCALLLLHVTVHISFLTCGKRVQATDGNLCFRRPLLFSTFYFLLFNFLYSIYLHVFIIIKYNNFIYS